jgi:hypothetical protein
VSQKTGPLMKPAERLAGELDAQAPRAEQAEFFGSGWNWDSPTQVKGAFARFGVTLDSTDDDDGPEGAVGAFLRRDGYNAIQVTAATAQSLSGKPRRGENVVAQGTDLGPQTEQSPKLRRSAIPAWNTPLRPFRAAWGGRCLCPRALPWPITSPPLRGFPDSLREISALSTAVRCVPRRFDASVDVTDAYLPPASPAQRERIASSSPSPSGTDGLGALA